MALPTYNPDDPVGGPGGGGGGGGSGAISTGTALFSFNFNKHEDSSILRVLAYASLSSGDDLTFTAFVTVDGIIRQSGRVNAIFDNQNSKAAMPITLPAFIAGLAAGNHSIVFSIRNQEPDSALTVLTGSTIEVTELKQAAV